MSIQSATSFIKAATDTAEHFGFEHIDTLKKRPECKEVSKKYEHSASANDRKTDALHGLLTGGMCTICENKLHTVEEPLLFYTVEQVPRSGEAALTLQVFGVEKSIAEALLIQTARSLVSDLGFSNHNVRINTLGDKDSVTRYIRELTNYMKKRLDDMPASARELMKEHVFAALMHLVEKEHEMAYKSPNPMEYLSDPSRKHFREIVEYLDMSETPYEIDPKLIGHHQCYSDALFAFDFYDENDQIMDQAPLYVRGGRYSEFVNRNSKLEKPAAGAVIVLREKKAPARSPRPQKGAMPSIYMVQLGFGPKIQSLMLVDELRQAGVPVMQNLACDSLSTQLRDAEAKNIRYAVIVGQKEFVEGNVILRDLHGRTQEFVPVSGITNRLKRIAA